MEKPKTCFLISPIGKMETETRQFADRVRDFLRYEVFQGDCEYVLTRADESLTVSTLTEVMINNIIDSDLVIALLDEDNPNVYYEIAIRHAAGKACLAIISSEYSNSPERHRVFDLQDVLKISFSREAMLKYTIGGSVNGGLLTFARDLRKAIQDYESGAHAVSNPIIRARRDFELPPRMTVGDLIHEALNAWKSDASVELAQTIVDKLYSVTGEAIATYIDGEDRAFQKLAEMTKKATRSLRTSRFAPQAIGETSRESSETKTDFFNALCEFGRRPNVTCKRIMCMNADEKFKDLWNTMNRTAGGSMELYLTKRNNNFELVVVDDIAAFLHFYDDKRRIKSTLLITSTTVIREFESIYDQILADRDYAFHVINCRECEEPNVAAHKYSVAKEKFPIKVEEADEVMDATESATE